MNSRTALRLALSSAVFVTALGGLPATGAHSSEAGRVAVANAGNGGYHLVSRAPNGNVMYYGAGENIGGVLSSAPSAAVLGSTLHVVGSNGGIVFHNRRIGGMWTGWTPLGLGSDPVAAAYNGELHVVYRAGNGNVVDSWFGIGGWRTANLGGIITGRPAVVAHGPEFHIVGANAGVVFQKWFYLYSFTWFDWAPVSTGSDPFAASYANEFHVVSRAPNGNVINSWYGAGGWRTQNLGGVIAGTPSAVVHLGEFYVVGAANGAVYQRAFTKAGWTDWAPIAAGREPVVTTFAFEALNFYDVYSRLDDGSILLTRYDNDVWSTKTLPR